MLIVIVGLAGLLSFSSATMVTGVSGVTGNEPRQEERLISHTVGSVEMVKQEQPKREAEAELPLQAEASK
jgi:hypothetical protein